MKWNAENHIIVRRWSCNNQVIIRESPFGHHSLVRGWSCQGNRVYKHWSHNRMIPNHNWHNGNNHDLIP